MTGEVIKHGATAGQATVAGDDPEAARQESLHACRSRILYAVTRSDVEAADTQWWEHKRRYPNDERFQHHGPDCWQEVHQREKESRELGLTEDEHEEREAFRKYFRLIYNQLLRRENDPADIPTLNSLLQLIGDWIRRHPQDRQTITLQEMLERDRLLCEIRREKERGGEGAEARIEALSDAFGKLFA